MNGDSKTSNPQVPEKTTAVPEVSKPVELTDDALASVSGGAGWLMGEMLTRISEARSEVSKTVARNFRG